MYVLNLYRWNYSTTGGEKSWRSNFSGYIHLKIYFQKDKAFVIKMKKDNCAYLHARLLVYKNKCVEKKLFFFTESSSCFI